MVATSRKGRRMLLAIAARLLAAAFAAAITAVFGYLLLHQDSPEHRNTTPPSLSVHP